MAVDEQRLTRVRRAKGARYAANNYRRRYAEASELVAEARRRKLLDDAESAAKKSWIGKVLGGAGAGAATGSYFGPWGALIGGVVGGAAGGISHLAEGPYSTAVSTPVIGSIGAAGQIARGASQQPSWNVKQPAGPQTPYAPYMSANRADATQQFPGGVSPLAAPAATYEQLKTGGSYPFKPGMSASTGQMDSSLAMPSGQIQGDNRMDSMTIDDLKKILNRPKRF